MTKYRSNRRRSGSPRKLNYISFFSLEECLQRLGHLDQRRWLPFIPQTRVDLEALNGDVYRFALREQRPVGLVVYGYVERIDRFSTHISGEVQVKWLAWAEITMLLVVAAGLVVAVLPCLALIALPAFFWFTRAYIAGLQDEQERLLYVIREAVSY